jgi:hypothetical protein
MEDLIKGVKLFLLSVVVGVITALVFIGAVSMLNPTLATCI